MYVFSKRILVLCIHWFIVKILRERMTQWKHVTIRFRTVSDQCILCLTRSKIQHEQGFSSAGIGFTIWYTRYCFLALIKLKEKKCHSTKWYIGCSQQFYFKGGIWPRNTQKYMHFNRNALNSGPTLHGFVPMWPFFVFHFSGKMFVPPPPFRHRAKLLVRACLF